MSVSLCSGSVVELLERMTGIWTSTSTALILIQVVKNVECPFPAALKTQLYVFPKNATVVFLIDSKFIPIYGQIQANELVTF